MSNLSVFRDSLTLTLTRTALAGLAASMLASCGGGAIESQLGTPLADVGGQSVSINTPYMVDPKPNPPLKYFGYALIDCGYDDPSDTDPKTNYVSEVAAFTNLGQMCIYQPTDNIVSRLNLMSQNAMQAMLSVQSIFFAGSPDSSTGSGLRFTLHPDYKARWATFIKTNNLGQHLPKLAAFYVADEPVWNGISYLDLKAASDTIKASFPTIVTALVEAPPGLANLQVPTSIDVVGFDHYAVPNPETDLNFQHELALLKSKRSAPWQKIMLVMDAQWLPFYGTAGYPETYMASVATSYYNIANADPDVIAMMGYTWPGGMDDPSQKGTRNLPQSVLDEHKRIGKLISRK